MTAAVSNGPSFGLTTDLYSLPADSSSDSRLRLPTSSSDDDDDDDDEGSLRTPVVAVRTPKRVMFSFDFAAAPRKVGARPELLQNPMCPEEASASEAAQTAGKRLGI